MNGFRILLLAAATLAPMAHADPKPAVGVAPVVGEWRGRYICGQGVTALHLRVTQDAKGKIIASFNFGPAPENPTVPKGAYAMAGVYDAKSRDVLFTAVEWINQPSGYGMVDLVGRMTADGSRLTGKVPFAGCTVFDLQRDAPLVG
jgi:hypothetical protein